MLKSLKLSNFRSFSDQSLEFNPNITLIVGPNATGKTNILESLFVLATTRSFRAKDQELIRDDGDFYRIEVGLDDDNLALGYRRSPVSTEKKTQLNGAGRPLKDHVGSLLTVLFEPNDLLLISGPPERRRRYLDFVLTQTHTGYLTTLQRYRRTLAQRNALLADWRGQESELFAWDVKLTELAADIDQSRQNLISYVNERIEDLYTGIAGSRELLSLQYRSLEGDDYSSAFLAALEQNRSRDIGAGFTTIGPHRDDFDISFKGSDINNVASRGEMRSVVLALKLAELAFIESTRGRKPLFLLDDVFSELDDARRKHLINVLSEYQTVITTTNADVSSDLTGDFTTIRTEDLTNG
ncbi:MAG TPA: DNA replication/repair protein RecF [Candidatus Saccharimonadales bacterium]|nr:DNA replication/repair protein RecF [Candidatus Saccharimonadales bacterium]